jgi:hypothetical protein
MRAHPGLFKVPRRCDRSGERHAPGVSRCETRAERAIYAGSSLLRPRGETFVRHPPLRAEPKPEGFRRGESLPILLGALLRTCLRR